MSVTKGGKLEWTEEVPAGVYETTVTTEDGGYTATHTLTIESPEGD